MGIIRPSWKIGGMWPVVRITLKMVERIEARVSSAKDSCSLVRWSSLVAGQGVDNSRSLLRSNPVELWVGYVGDHPVDVWKGKVS